MKKICYLYVIIFITSILGCKVYTQEELAALQKQSFQNQASLFGECNLNFEGAKLPITDKWIPVDSVFGTFDMKTGFKKGVIIDGKRYYETKSENGKEVSKRVFMDKYVIKYWSVGEYRDLSTKSGLPKSVEEKINRIKSGEKGYENIIIEENDFINVTGKDFYGIYATIKKQDPLNLMPDYMLFLSWISEKDLQRLKEKKNHGCSEDILESSILNAYAKESFSQKTNEKSSSNQKTREELEKDAALSFGRQAHYRFLVVKSQDILANRLNIKKNVLERELRAAKQSIKYKPVISSLISCASGLIANKLTENPIIAGGISEALSSLIDDRSFSIENAEKEAVKNTIVMKLKEEEYYDAANLIETSDFLWCAINALR